MRRFWRPKRGPVLRWSRAVHLAIGFLLPLIGRWLWGDEGHGWVSAATGLGAIIWEATTAWWGWEHPYGDVVDLAAFLLGISLAALAGAAT